MNLFPAPTVHVGTNYNTRRGGYEAGTPIAADLSNVARLAVTVTEAASEIPSMAHPSGIDLEARAAQQGLQQPKPELAPEVQ